MAERSERLRKFTRLLFNVNAVGYALTGLATLGLGFVKAIAEVQVGADYIAQPTAIGTGIAGTVLLGVAGWIILANEKNKPGYKNS